VRRRRAAAGLATFVTCLQQLHELAKQRDARVRPHAGVAEGRPGQVGQAGSNSSRAMPSSASERGWPAASSSCSTWANSFSRCSSPVAATAGARGCYVTDRREGERKLVSRALPRSRVYPPRAADRRRAPARARGGLGGGHRGRGPGARLHEDDAWELAPCGAKARGHDPATIDATRRGSSVDRTDPRR
jgi:hypothetical protein